MQAINTVTTPRSWMDDYFALPALTRKAVAKGLGLTDIADYQGPADAVRDDVWLVRAAVQGVTGQLAAAVHRARA